MTDESGAQVIEDDKKSDIIVDDAPKVEEKQKELATSDNELEKIRAELEKSRKKEQFLESQLQEANRGRTEATSRVVTETNNRLSAEEVAIANAIAASTAEAERLEAEVVAAQENGKFSEAAKLTRHLASAQTKIDGWTNRKEQFEQQKRTFEQQKKSRAAEPEYPRSKAWIDAHPQFNTDDKFKNKVLALHHEAQAEGLAIDSEDYIDYIDSRINAKPVVEEAPIQQATQRKTIASTPPSRSQGMSNTQQRETNRLSPEEAEMAVLAWPKLKAAEAQKRYLESKQALIASGKIAGHA
jgi:chromosome segregation ATPase